MGLQRRLVTLRKMEMLKKRQKRSTKKCVGTVNVEVVTLHFNIQRANCDRAELSITLPQQMQTKWLKTRKS